MNVTQIAWRFSGKAQILWRFSVIFLDLSFLHSHKIKKILIAPALSPTPQIFGEEHGNLLGILGAPTRNP
jgi:hypothetical protein